MFFLGCEVLTGFRANLSVQEIFAKAGEYFYIGVSYLYGARCFIAVTTTSSTYKCDCTNCYPMNGPSGVCKIKKELLRLCNMAEEIMSIDSNYKLIFDYLLISLCIICNGSRDIGALKILNRTLSQSHQLKNLVPRVEFVEGKFITSHGLRYGDILKYKLCLSVLYNKLQPDALFELVSSFFINFPLSEFDNVQYQTYRFLIYRKMDLSLFKEVELDKSNYLELFDAACNYLEANGPADGNDLDVFGFNRTLDL